MKRRAHINFELSVLRGIGRGITLDRGIFPCSVPLFFLLTIDLVQEFQPIRKEMDGDTFSGLGHGVEMDSKVMQTFQKTFVQVQKILDQNRLLINEINQNHEFKLPDNLNRNNGLIRELNNNIRRVVHLYADLSSSVTKSMETSSDVDSSGALRSDGRATHKRSIPG